jgi:hypothetical protein
MQPKFDVRIRTNYYCLDQWGKIQSATTQEDCKRTLKNSSIFWDICPCSPVKVSGRSEDHIASIFRDKE